MARAFNDCKVLVVEDNPTCQRFLEVCLHSIGFDVSVASDGEQALAILVANSFDLVLLDVQLPRVNGIEVARRLRAEGNAVPIIAVTANAFHADHENCLAAGMDAYLQKPFTLSELLTQIAVATANR